MFCSKCGAKNEDSAKFCYQCGNRFEDAVPVNQPQPQAPAENYTYSQPQAPAENYTYSQPQAPVENYTYSQPQGTVNNQQPPVVPQGPVYGQPQNPNYQMQGTANNQPPQQPYYQPQPPYGQTPGQGYKMPAKSKKPLFISLAGIAAVAVIIIVVLTTSSSAKGNVLDNLLKAMQGTIEAGSVEFSLEETRYYSGKQTEKAKGVFVYDLKNEELGYDIKVGDDERTILYNGIMYEIEDDEVWWSTDYTSEIEDIFYYYDEYKGAFNGISKIDWEDIIDEAGISMLVDTDALQKCLKNFEKDLNSEDFYKKVFKKFSVDKSSKGTKYTFEDIKIKELVKALADTFKPVINYDIDDLLDEATDEFDIFDEFLVEITIKDNKLVEIYVDISVEDWSGDTDRREITMTFDKYGKAALDEDDIEDVIDNSYQW